MQSLSEVAHNAQDEAMTEQCLGEMAHHAHRFCACIVSFEPVRRERVTTRLSALLKVATVHVASGHRASDVSGAGRPTPIPDTCPKMGALGPAAAHSLKALGTNVTELCTLVGDKAGELDDLWQQLVTAVHQEVDGGGSGTPQAPDAPAPAEGDTPVQRAGHGSTLATSGVSVGQQPKIRKRCLYPGCETAVSNPAERLCDDHLQEYEATKKTHRQTQDKWVARSATGASPSAETTIFAAPERKCVQCGVIQTPLWRNGPLGKKTLCNACGTRRLRRRDDVGATTEHHE
jgi:hypothetical protein